MHIYVEINSFTICLVLHKWDQMPRTALRLGLHTYTSQRDTTLHSCYQPPQVLRSGHRDRLRQDHWGGGRLHSCSSRRRHQHHSARPHACRSGDGCNCVSKTREKQLRYRVREPSTCKVHCTQLPRQTKQQHPMCLKLHNYNPACCVGWLP